MINNKFNRYYANLRLILKEKQECLEFYDDTIKLNKLQKKADLNLFYQKPFTYLIRFLIYLPINLIRILKNANNHFYLVKLRNEVEILKFEIQDIQNKNG
tara:strand:- start:118 stop:417 length:300 start_codon:yes stop_codon:yes gene_type:complete